MNPPPGPQRSLWQLCVPLLLNSVLGLATTLLDAAILSHHSQQAVAAISVANQILAAAYDSTMLLAIGSVVLLTQALGRGDAAQARRLASLALAGNAVLGALIGLLLWCVAPALVRAMDTPPELQADVVRYVRLLCLVMPAHALLMAGTAALRGFALVRVLLWLGVLAFPSYALLSFVLVLGAGPVPALGVYGSALATMAVRVLSVLVLGVVLVRLLGLRLPRPAWDGVRELWRMARLAAPSVLDNVSYGFYQLVLLSFVAGLGVATVASRFFALTLGAFLAVVVMAVSQANEVLVGYHLGAGQAAVARQRAWRSALWSAALATGLSLLLWLAAEPLTALFSSDPAVQQQVRSLMLLTVLIQPLTGLNTVLFHSLRVSGDVTAPVLFSQVVMWGVATPLAWVLAVPAGLGLAGLWWAFIAEEALKTGYMVWRWSRPRPVAAAAVD